ncbi:hypothetical protein ACQKP7_21340 [Pseudomonas frederiksbergensis]|uniref:hypothetical protein n=1 Tax=Pseudomonas frederiksbergensis TaxID=104087 RepID=UPI003D04719B
MNTSTRGVVFSALSFLVYSHGCLAEDDRVQACQSNWFASPAYRSCQTVVKMDDGQSDYQIVNANSPGCLIIVGCVDASQRTVPTEFQGTNAAVRTLGFCDGKLKTGGC